MVFINKREKEILQLRLHAEEDIIAELEKQYRVALNDINRKIRLLMSDELTQSKIYQIEYQKALKGQIEGILEKLHGDEFSTIQKYLHDCYEDAFIGTVYDMAGQGIPLIMPIDQAAAVKAIVTDSKVSKGLYDSLGVDVKHLKKAIRQEITRGISTAQTYEDIARNISEVSKAPISNAKRIARTEGHRIQQASTMDAQERAKAKGADVVKQWDSTLDGATRPTHRRLDGQIREVDEPFEMDGKKAMYPGGFGDPAEDCNCRCASLTRARWGLDKAELQTLKDRAKFFGLDKTKDFEDFKGKYLKASEEIKGYESNYNPKTMPSQFKMTEAMNEYDYFDEEQEQFRLAAIQEMSGADEAQSRKYLDALCGQRDDYIRTRNGGDEYATSWFYGADGKIRSATSGEFFDKAETIHDYIVRSPKYEGEIYRGLSLSKEQIQEFRHGGIFEENGLLSSWTSSMDVADMFAQGRSEELGLIPVIIKTKNPKYGTPVSHLSIFGQEEQEVLVSNLKNSQYTIGNITEKDGLVIIELLG